MSSSSTAELDLPVFGGVGSASEARASSPSRGTAPVLVIGLGNPILGDDGFGWAVVAELQHLLRDRDDVELDCLAVGGLGLMERLIGHHRAILLDVIETGAEAVGTIRTMQLSDLETVGTGHTASAHDASLATALATARSLGAEVPDRVDIIAVEANVQLYFSEALSEPVLAAVPAACQMVQTLLEH